MLLEISFINGLISYSGLFNSIISNKEVISLGLYDFLDFFTNDLYRNAESFTNTTSDYKLEVSEQTLAEINNFQNNIYLNNRLLFL